MFLEVSEASGGWQQVGPVECVRHRLRVERNHDGVIADVVQMALSEPGQGVAGLLDALKAGSEGYSSGAGHFIHPILCPDDIPPEFVDQITPHDINRHELWYIARDSWGQGTDHVVIEGNALRDLVRRAGEVLGRT